MRVLGICSALAHWDTCLHRNALPGQSLPAPLRLGQPFSRVWYSTDWHRPAASRSTVLVFRYFHSHQPQSRLQSVPELQGCCSTLLPSCGHARSGVEQTLVRCCTPPPPQVTEHLLQTPHLAHVPTQASCRQGLRSVSLPVRQGWRRQDLALSLRPVPQVTVQRLHACH